MIVHLLMKIYLKKGWGNVKGLPDAFLFKCM